MTVSTRQYQDESDYTKMRAFLIEILPHVAPQIYCTIGDMDWWRWTDDNPDVMESVRLWLDEYDHVVGIAWPGPKDGGLIVHPRHRAIQTEMLAWSESNERQRLMSANGQDSAAGARLTVWAYSQDDERQLLLRAHGFQRQDSFFALRGRTLHDQLPQPVVPDGYQLRHVTGESDLERRVAVHRDAFAPSRMTVAKHRGVMSAPTYRADLDLIVEATDRTFAAFCICWYDEFNRAGVFEPVGCHSAHRRRGLGKAIMLEGMRRLKSLGARTAYVISWLDEGPASALYESVGMPVLDRNYAWEKALSHEVAGRDR